MHDDRLLEICESEFVAVTERIVEEFFAAAARLPNAKDFRKTPFLELPVIDGKFFAGFEPPEQRQIVVRALAAAFRFSKTAPLWAPDLPLCEAAIAEFKDAGCAKINLVGYYADSLKSASWVSQHPPFDAYCKGLMAYESTPGEILNDLELRCEFPPRPLPGLCDGRLDWRSIKRLTFDRKIERRVAAYEAGEDPWTLPWLHKQQPPLPVL